MAGSAKLTATTRVNRDLLDGVLELALGTMKLGAVKFFVGKGFASEYVEEWSHSPQTSILEFARAWLALAEKLAGLGSLKVAELVAASTPTCM